MPKKVKTLLMSLVGAAALLGAAPASAGIFVFYYFDYVGGTPAGYAVYCNDGSLFYSYGNTSTGILIYHHQDTGC